MNVRKTAFFSTLWLMFGIAGLSGTAFAADPSTAKPETSQMDAQRMGAQGNEEPMKCEHQGGMMKGRMGCDHKSGMMCDHKGGMMGGQMGCDHKGGMMCDHKGGMMGGHDAGMMGPSRLHMVMALDLSDDQRSKINKLHDELRHNNWATKGLIMDESAKLRDLYAADKPNPSDIGKVYQKIFDLKRKMIEAMITTQNRMEELLTPEQRTQLKDMRHHKAGPMHDHPMH